MKINMKNFNVAFILIALALCVFFAVSCTSSPIQTTGSTPTATATATPTLPSTVPPTPTESSSATATFTAEAETPTATSTFTDIPTITPTATVTVSPTITTTVTVKPETPTPTATSTSTPTPSTVPPTPTATPTPTPTPTPVRPLYSQKPDYSKLNKAKLPRVDVKTENAQTIESKESYVKATVSLSECKEEYVFSDSPAGIRLRGNSTAVAPKKPYRIKFDTKQSFLGLNDGNEFKSWCLMADYYDGSMLRTWATFKFADVLLENKYYSADCTHVELYINGEYNGVYLLCEQTQIDNDRIDIPEKKENDKNLELGYLLVGQGGRTDEPETVIVYPEIDVYDRNGEKRHFGSMNFALSGSGYTAAQKKYVSDYVSGVFKVVAKALYENEYYTLLRNGKLVKKTVFKGKTTQEKQIETINAVFNIESAVSMCVLDEIAKNLDAMTFNMYVDLSPNGDGRLTLAAPWDFDFAMANTHYATTHGTSGFYATNFSVSEGMRTNLWFVMLGSIDWFEEKCTELWKKHYTELKSIAYETYEMSYVYQEAFDRDYTKWGLPANRSLIHHHCVADLNTFKKHLDSGEFLGDWLIKRLVWLDRQWGNTEPEEKLEQSELLIVDFTKQESLSYLNGFKRCEGEITSQGLKMSLIEARDPYFYIDFSALGEVFEAEDYPYLEIECLVPMSNALDFYSAEVFLCSGSTASATAGVSVNFDLGMPTGRMTKYRIDLSKSGFWNGDIHRLRFDYFNGCEVGDYIIIKSVSLKIK